MTLLVPARAVSPAQQQPARPLVQHRGHLGERTTERLREPHDLSHSTTLEIIKPEVDLI